MKSVLANLLTKTLREYSQAQGISLPDPLEYDLMISRDPAHGDFATNLPFKLARLFRKRPNQIADELVLLLEKKMQAESKLAGIERFEVAGNGFINFYFEKDSLAQILIEIHKKDRRYGASEHGAGKRVLLEFVSANPTGPLTIAHGRQAAVGDALARILRCSGYEVHTEYYLNDAGRQMNLLGASLWVRYLELLGQSRPLPEDGYRGEYLVKIAEKLVRDKKDKWLKEDETHAVVLCRQFAMDEIMGDILKDLDRIHVKFDQCFRESGLYEKGAVDEALNNLTDHGHLYEKDGALWFRSTAFGDDKDRVVKRSSGEYTYLAPDIAYHRHKFQRGFNWLINFWGPDHHGYISRLKAACQALGHSAEEVSVRIVQLTTLYRKGEPVRMSTRAGEFVTLKELCDEVGVDATRFFFIMRRIESHLDFDLELAKEKSQENPVYYLQYAHARIASLLRYAARPVHTKADLGRLATQEEGELLKVLSEFPKVLIHASEALEPYTVADYLRELAASFHKFYTLHRIVTEDESLTDARLLLADCTRIVLRNGLELLGISQPESM